MPEKSPLLTPELVQHIASLVQIGLSEAEAEAFVPQLNAILEYFNLLQEVDTTQVPPAFLLSGPRNVFRPDRPEPGLTRQAFLSNVPRRQREYVCVPIVLEE